MSDATTPTAYVEELAQLGYRAEVDWMVNEQIPTWAMNRWEDLPIDAHDSYRVVAKASAEKVLRDVLALARVDELGWQKVRLIQAVQIEQFAAERGLDLEGGAQ